MKSNLKKMMNVLLFALLMSVMAAAARAQASLDNPAVFDANFYLGKYSELCAASPLDTAKAKEHWLKSGIAEGRQASPVFDAKYYLSLYPDLHAAFGEQGYELAIGHWLANGINEGRRASREFDSGFYLSNNPDVNALCSGERACAIWHWQNFGINEKRRGAADFDYTAQPPAVCKLPADCYTVVAKHSAKCVDGGGNPPLFPTLVQWDCISAENQQWLIRPTTDGYYTLTSLSSGKNMKIKDGSAAYSTPVVAAEPSNEDSQKFNLVSIGDGYFYIVSKVSGQVFDIYAVSLSSGATLVQNPNWGGDNQKFKLVRSNISTITLKSTQTTVNSDGVKTAPFQTEVRGNSYTGVPNQTPYVKLNVGGRLASYNGQKYLHLNLKDSRISASINATLGSDNDSQRGYYLESATVRIRPIDRQLRIKTDSPETTEGSGATTSSSGIDLSTGATISNEPGVNFGVGLNFGNSYTENLSDFSVVNTSDISTAEHHYLLTSTNAVATAWNTAGGKVKYEKWQDLVRMDASGQFSGTPLNTLPSLAKSGLPLLSQGIWLVDAGYSGKAIFEITIEATLRNVEKTNHFFWVDRNTDAKTVTLKHLVLVDFSAVN